MQLVGAAEISYSFINLLTTFCFEMVLTAYFNYNIYTKIIFLLHYHFLVQTKLQTKKKLSGCGFQSNNHPSTTNIINFVPLRHRAYLEILIIIFLCLLQNFIILLNILWFNNLQTLIPKKEKVSKQKPCYYKFIIFNKLRRWNVISIY